MRDVTFYKSYAWLNIGNLVDFSHNLGSLIKVRPKWAASTSVIC